MSSTHTADPLFHVASWYARAHAAFRLPGRARGLGWLLRHTRRERVLRYNGCLMYYDPRIAGCYDGIVGGGRGEQETHRFFAALLDSLPAQVQVHYLDVGANIGELLVDVARHPRVRLATAFEPHPTCAKVCELDARMNDLQHKIDVRNIALSSSKRAVRFRFNHVTPQSSGIVPEDQQGTDLTSSTLDDEVPADPSMAYVLKIDVEGAELDVLRGGAVLVRERRPLIVFEYHAGTRRHFGLDELLSALGPTYEVFRLRGDGRLDRDLAETWNCVAVANDGPMADAADRLIDRG